MRSSRIKCVKLFSHSHPWRLWQYRGEHTQLTRARWALQPLHLSACLWEGRVCISTSAVCSESKQAMYLHMPFTGYYFAVVLFLLRKVLLVPGLSALEYYFYFITSGSPTANKQGISSSSRQDPMAQDFWAQGRQQESARTVFSLTELHTSVGMYINYVLSCKRGSGVTYKKQAQSFEWEYPFLHAFLRDIDIPAGGTDLSSCCSLSSPLGKKWQKSSMMVTCWDVFSVSISPDKAVFFLRFSQWVLVYNHRRATCW